MGYLILAAIAIGLVVTYWPLAVGVVLVAGAIFWQRRQRNAEAIQANTVNAILLDVSPAGKWVEVVGENSYQGSLVALAQGRNIDGGNVRDHTALLVPEPDNRYDPNAVSVRINGQTVGYLSRADATAYRPTFDRYIAAGAYPGVRASLSGGWDRGGGERGSFGVRLAMGTPREVQMEFVEWLARQPTVEREGER